MNYHLEVININIGSTAHCVSYQFGINAYDKLLGKYYYQSRDDVLFADILLPKDAAHEYSVPQTFIDEVEWAETRRGTQRPRRDARTLRMFIGSLPQELPVEANIGLAKGYAMSFIEQGMCAALAVHSSKIATPEKYNPHMHMLLTTRPIEADGRFSIYKGQTLGLGWDNRGNIEKWRASFADMINQAYEQDDSKLRVDHRSFVRQGKNREALKWLNRRDYELELRGERTARGDENRAIMARNAERESAERERRRKENERETLRLIQQEIYHGWELER
jgi:hypothetical protein